jgi:hypothetical protein
VPETLIGYHSTGVCIEYPVQSLMQSNRNSSAQQLRPRPRCYPPARPTIPRPTERHNISAYKKLLRRSLRQNRTRLNRAYRKWYDTTTAVSSDVPTGNPDREMNGHSGQIARRQRAYNESAIRVERSAPELCPVDRLAQKNSGCGTAPHRSYR